LMQSKLMPSTLLGSAYKKASTIGTIIFFCEMTALFVEDSDCSTADSGGST
jgi:hypothetical protein